MWVDAGPGQFAGQPLLKMGTDVVFDALGRFVQMVERQIKMLAQICLPEAMRAHERLRCMPPLFGKP